MLIFQKNFNTPQGGSWFTPQFNVSPEEQGVQTQTAPSKQTSSRANTPLNSSYNPEILNSNMQGLGGLTRKALYKNEQEAIRNQVQSSSASQVNSIATEGTRNTSKPYNPNTDSPLVNVDENVPIVETLAEEEEELPTPSNNPNPQNSSSNNSGQTNPPTNTQSSVETTTGENTTTPDTNATSGQSSAQAPGTEGQTGQGLIDKFKDIKGNAAQKFGELSSKYGEGVSGSLAGDLGLAAGGLALAGGAYHLIKKRKEKKKAEKEALNARISK